MPSSSPRPQDGGRLRPDHTRPLFHQSLLDRLVQEEPWPAERVEAALRQRRDEDASFAKGQILGSMCTAPHEAAARAFGMYLETNLGDPDHFPGTARLEQEALADLRGLLSAPQGAGARLVTGGNEANLLACYLAREKTGKGSIVVPDSCHFSFDKAARLLGMDLVRVPTVDHRADPDAMGAAVDEDTALMVAVAGTTELGLVDPVPELAAEAQDAGVPLHVDAAWGGYILPFLEAAGEAPRPFDFDVPGVWSVGMDPHKMGMAPIPAGALVVAKEADWSRVAVETSYVSTDGQSTLLGTRPGAAAAAVWAVHRSLGRSGYAQQVRRSLATTRRLADGLTAAGAELVAEPELNLLTFRYKDAHQTHARLAEAGFRLNVVPRFQALRIVVNPHVTDPVADRFLETFQAL